MASLAPLFSLFLYLAVKANVRERKERWSRETVQPALVGLVGLLCAVVFFGGVGYSFIDSVGETHVDVANHKSYMRALCTDFKEHKQEDEELLSSLASLDPHFTKASSRPPSNPLLAQAGGDLAMGRHIVGNNVIGKQLAREHQAKERSFFSSFSSFGNSLIANWGPLLPAAPFLVLGIAYLLAPNNPFFSSPGSFFPIRMALAVGISVSSFVNFVVFNFLVDYLRGVWCVHISGHWYTYCVTTFIFFTALAHLNAHQPNSLPSFYLIYFIIYQYLALSCLSETQLFFHDRTDAETGVWAACSLGLPFFFLSFLLSKALISSLNGGGGASVSILCCFCGRKRGRGR